MSVIVQKYGGSSLESIEKIKKVAKCIIKKRNEKNDVVVVVSAMGDTTDNLIKLANKISDNPDKRELDALMSTGEMVSASLLAMAVKSMGYDAISFTAYQIKMSTSGQYGKSVIEDIDTARIRKSLDEGKIVIVAGFQGINGSGDITTLGRGGSDTTAVAIAVKLNGKCEIYTDVDGIYSCDPRKYEKAGKLDEIDYEEMLELSSLGAQVMNSRSVELAQKYGVSIYVGLSASDVKGTVIRGIEDMNMEKKPVTGIATSDDDVAVTLNGISSDINVLSRVFEAIAKKKINVDMISQTLPLNGKINVSFSIPKDDLDECINVLKEITSNIEVDTDLTKLSMVGIGMKTTSGVAARLFRLFIDNNIEVKMITTSEIRITCGIKHDDKMKAIKVAAEEFNL